MAENAIPPWVLDLHNETLGIPRILASGIQARVFVGQHVMLSVVKIEPNSVGTMHSHPEEQWGVLLEGECTRLQGNQAVTMKAIFGTRQVVFRTRASIGV